MKSRFGSNVEFFSAAPFYYLVGLALKIEYILILPHCLSLKRITDNDFHAYWAIFILSWLCSMPDYCSVQFINPMF